MGRSRLKIWPVILLVLALGGHANAIVIDRIVAVVNKEIITLSDVQEVAGDELRGLQGKFEGEELDGEMEAAQRRYLDQLIIRSLQLQRAQELNMEVTERDIELAVEDVKQENNLTQSTLETLLAREGITFDAYRQRITEEIMIRRVINFEVQARIEVSSEEIEDYYQANAADFLPPEQLRASHILVVAPQNGDGVEALEAEARAEVLLERAKSGEDFAELARLHSEDASGAPGGDLGLIRRGEILPDIEAVLFSLQQGEIGPLVRTSAGYHIIKLTEKTSQEAPPFEQVSDRIRNHVYTEKLNVRYERWLEELKKKAYIEVSM